MSGMQRMPSSAASSLWWCWLYSLFLAAFFDKVHAESEVGGKVCGIAVVEQLLAAHSVGVALKCMAADGPDAAAGCFPTREHEFQLPSFGDCPNCSGLQSREGEMVRVGVDTAVVETLLAGPSITDSTARLLRTHAFINGTTSDGECSSPPPPFFFSLTLLHPPSSSQTSTPCMVSCIR